MNHSPAPWSFQIREYQIFPEKRDPDQRHILGIEDANGIEIVTTDSGYYGPELRDARLIAAAPDLLRLLTELLIQAEPLAEIDHDLIDECHAVLIKAENL